MLCVELDAQKTRPAQLTLGRPSFLTRGFPAKGAVREYQSQLSSVAQHDLCDHACRDCREHVVAVYTHPVVTARGLMQSVAAIILDHILTIAIVVRQAVTAAPVVRIFAVRVIGAAVSPAIICVHRRAAVVVMLAALLAVILILMTTAIVALHAGATRALLLSAVIVVATGTVFSERRRCQTQACEQQCSSNMTFLHEYHVQRCKCAASMNHPSCISRPVAKVDTLRNLYIPCRASIAASVLSR